MYLFMHKYLWVGILDHVFAMDDYSYYVRLQLFNIYDYTPFFALYDVKHIMSMCSLFEWVKFKLSI